MLNILWNVISYIMGMVAQHGATILVINVTIVDRCYYIVGVLN